MKAAIHSRESIEALIHSGSLPENTAVVSFYSPKRNNPGDYAPVDYHALPTRLFYACVPDIDIETLPHFGLTLDTYFENVNELAMFIRSAVADGLDIICQCDYGQSRSAACCAAILEYYERTGITIFADYRYYPNQLVFNKVLTALRCAD